MKTLESIVTSYNLSLGLKDLGAPQDDGIFYWGVSNDEPELFQPTDMTNQHIVCRAFTTDELLPLFEECHAFISIEEVNEFDLSPKPCEFLAVQLIDYLKQKRR